MRSSYTPKEVTHIEDKAYEVGIRIGTQQERLRILTLLEEWLNDDYGDFDKMLVRIKGDNHE
jgi:hypothetical protein